MSRSYFSQCPRCGSSSYENLSSHGHCFECLYSPDLYATEKRDFLTLKEAEALIQPAPVHKIPRKKKKISGAAS